MLETQNDVYDFFFKMKSSKYHQIIQKEAQVKFLEEVKRLAKIEIEEEIQDELFSEQEEIKPGDQFMACKPWKGTITPPSTLPPINKEKPSKGLQIEYVYGYRNHDATDNLFYNVDEEIVYSTAGVGVIMNPDTNEQRIFGGHEEIGDMEGHTEDVVSMAIATDKTTFATGEVGLNPLIFIWDSKTLTLLNYLSQGKGSRAVKCLAFSENTKFLATVGFDDDHTTHLFDWRNSEKIASSKTGGDPLISMEFCPREDLVEYCAVGIHGAKFCTFKDGQFKVNKGQTGSEIMDFTCVKYLDDGRCLCGATTGEIHVFSGNVSTKAVKTHQGSLTALATYGNSIVITSGIDKKLNFYGKALDLKFDQSLPGAAISIDVNHEGKMLIGCRDGSIRERFKDKERILMYGHNDGELWGITICPTTGLIATTGDDNRILVWDPKKRVCVAHSIICPNQDLFQEEGKVKTFFKKKKNVTLTKIMGGASTFGTHPPYQCARAITIAKCGHVAVGINTGAVSVRKSLKEMWPPLTEFKHSHEWIEVMRYSPNDAYLAVGSHDNRIYVYSVLDYSLLKVMKGHSSYVTSLDWSMDNKFIKSTCGAYELLFWNLEKNKQFTSGGSALKDELWATYTTKLGWWVEGIYPPYTDGTHINDVDISTDYKLVLTGNDHGLVSLYNAPCRRGAKGRDYRGHSEHVIRIEFDETGSRAYSLGGFDQTMIQWKIVDHVEKKNTMFKEMYQLPEDMDED